MLYLKTEKPKNIKCYSSTLSLWFLYIYNLSTSNFYSPSTIAVPKVYLLLAFINLPTSNFYSLSTKSLNKFSTSNHYNLLIQDTSAGNVYIATSSLYSLSISSLYNVAYLLATSTVYLLTTSTVYRLATTTQSTY